MISSRNMASNRSQRRGALEDSQLFDLLYDWDENDDMDFDPPDVAAYLEEALSVLNLLLFFVNHKLILFFFVQRPLLSVEMDRTIPTEFDQQEVNPKYFY